MPQPEFDVIFATSETDLNAVQSLRYDVFIRELGGNGPNIDHARGLEQDDFDPHSRHLMLLDRNRGPEVSDQIVGVYRLLDKAGANRVGGFYSEHEFDLNGLLTNNQRVLELGRSCLHKDYRGGMAMYHLWSALARYVLSEKFDILFGVASFHGTDETKLRGPLALLKERYLAPEEQRPIARAPSMDMPDQALSAENRKAAMTQMPALIKAYLRLGGRAGLGGFVDHAFNTTDVCLVLDLAKIDEKQRNLYTRDRP